MVVGLVQDWGNSSALAMESLQSRTKSMGWFHGLLWGFGDIHYKLIKRRGIKMLINQWQTYIHYEYIAFKCQAECTMGMHLIINSVRPSDAYIHQ